MRLRAVAAAAALLLLLAAAGRWVWLPRWRPALRDGETYGVDVSAHQGAVDWRRVRGDGIAFAYVKATEGRDHTDERYAANAAAARAAGLAVGAYHFLTLCAPGAEQAAHFLRTVPDRLDLAPALDLELAGNCAARPPVEEVRASVAAYLASVEARDGPALLYVGADFARRYRAAIPARERWVSRALRRPSTPYAVWQASSWARVDGIGGGVDLDVR